MLASSTTFGLDWQAPSQTLALAPQRLFSWSRAAPRPSARLSVYRFANSSPCIWDWSIGTLEQSNISLTPYPLCKRRAQVPVKMPRPTRLDLRGGPLRWRWGSGGGLFAGVVLPLLALMASLGAVQSFVLGGSNSKLALRAASSLGGGGGSGGEIGDVDEAYLGGGGPLRQLQLRYSCDDVDNEELSELLFECGVLSVSVEGESERPEDHRRAFHLVGVIGQVAHRRCTAAR